MSTDINMEELAYIFFDMVLWEWFADWHHLWQGQIVCLKILEGASQVDGHKTQIVHCIPPHKQMVPVNGWTKI